MKRGVRGFTIVELLVVVAVIGVLAGITVVGYARYQATTRDSQRESKATVIAEALEKYYQAHGEYPGCIDLTNTTAATVVGTGGALESVDAQTLVTPQAGSGVENSIQCTDLTSISGNDIFAYIGDGSPTCQSGTSCLQYTIKYKNEVDGTIATIPSRHQTDIATSGGTTITSTSVNATRIDVSWNEIKNANSYILERATNAGFTTGISDTPISASSTTVTTSVTGLSSGTHYWFKVRGVSTSGNTAWTSSTDSYTYPAAPTGVNATTTSTTQVSVTWSGVTGANTYRVQRSTTANFQSGTTGSASNISGSPYTYTGLQQGTQYWFRVYATGNAGEGSASSNDNAITTLPAPDNLIATSGGSSITLDWDPVTNATAYDVQYSNNNFSSVLGSFNNQTETTRNITGLSTATQYWFRVYAKNAAITSAAASTSQYTTLPSPTSVTASWTNNYGSNSQSATCSIGSPQFSRATTYRQDGVRAASWGTWSAWTTGTTFATDFINPGNFGMVKVKAKCVMSGAESPEVESAPISKVRPIDSYTSWTEYIQQTSPAKLYARMGCYAGQAGNYSYMTRVYNWGELYHGSAGTHSYGGWDNGDALLLTNGTPNWSMNDGLNAYRISRSICQSNYYERSWISNVAGGTLQGTGANQYNGFVGGCNNGSYCYGVERYI